MIAYEIASSMIGITMWCYLGGLIGLVWGLHGILLRMAEDRVVRAEAKAFVRDFLEGRTTLPSDLLDVVEADRLVASPWEERPVRSSSTPGPMELRLQAAHRRARPVVSCALGYGNGKFQKRAPALLFV